MRKYENWPIYALILLTQAIEHQAPVEEDGQEWRGTMMTDTQTCECAHAAEPDLEMVKIGFDNVFHHNKKKMEKN